MSTVRKRRALLLDVSTLLDEQWTGIPVFTRRLISALLRSGKVELDFVCGSDPMSRECVLAAIREGNGTRLHEFRQTRKRRRRSFLRPDRPLFYPSVKRTFGLMSREASTVHDLSTLLMPDNHVERNVEHHLEHFSKELRTDDVVFCASEATRAALTTALPSVAAKTRVLHQYVDWPEEFAMLDRNLPDPRLGRYAVVIGTVEPRKNLTLLLNALNEPAIAKSQLRFLVVGRMGWKTEQLLQELTPAQRERVQFTGFVSEFTKYRLIRHCEFLVYPSIYEGFGIPALEAMSLGKPVLAARTSSFPEVVGRAGVFFDPFSVTEFAAAFAEIDVPANLAQLSRKALRQSAQFNWSRMAQPVIDWTRS